MFYDLLQDEDLKRVFLPPPEYSGVTYSHNKLDSPTFDHRHPIHTEPKHPYTPSDTDSCRKSPWQYEGKSCTFEGRSCTFEGRSCDYEGRSCDCEGRSWTMKVGNLTMKVSHLTIKVGHVTIKVGLVSIKVGHVTESRSCYWR